MTVSKLDQDLGMKRFLFQYLNLSKRSKSWLMCILSHQFYMLHSQYKICIYKWSGSVVIE